jgi:GH24 family phage-related lysozyme (muramidase)
MRSLLFIFLLIKSNICFSYSDPKTWDPKKSKSIEFSMNLIMNREKFVPYCYSDASGWSAGWGDYTWCEETIKNMRFKNPLLKYIPDEILRKQVKITKEQAKWRLKKFVINVYDKLETMIDLTNYDEIEIAGLIDFIYTIGETKFYNKTTLFKILQDKNLIFDIKTCVRIRNNFLEWSKMKKNGKYIIAKGVENRRHTEYEFFLYRKCVF